MVVAGLPAFAPLPAPLNISSFRNLLLLELLMTVATDPIRVALIGFGFVGKTFHAPLIQSVPGLELTAVSSRHPETVREVLPRAQVLSNPGEAATHADVDLVVIASPNETHVPLATAALSAGKNVIVDKPFTITLAEARRLVQLSREKRRLLSVFQNRRWDSDFLGARAIIEEGRLGEILHFESHLDRFRPEVRKRWREVAGPGAGLWYDLGPHLVDQTLQLFGLPEKLIARLVRQRPQAQTDDWFHVLLDYGRLQAILHGSVVVAGGIPRMAIHGTGGSWLKYGWDLQEEQLIAGVVPGDPGWGEDPRPGIFYSGSQNEMLELPVPKGDHRQYYFGIRDAILNQASNPVTPVEAIAVMAVLETAIESSAKGQALSLPLTDQERADWQSASSE
jgi:predicted dehydrogenase